MNRSRSLREEITRADKDVDSRAPWGTVSGNVNAENIWRFFRKLKIKLPHDPAILLLDIYPKKMKSLS